MDLSPKANETESSGRYCEVDLYKAKYYTTGTVIKKVNNFICYDPDLGRVYPVRGMVKAGTICKDLENYCQPVTIAKNIHGLEDGTRGPGGKVFVDTSVSINETTGYEVEGLASYHFNSKPYVSYENTNIINIVTGKIQAQGPLYSIFTDFYAKVSEFKTDLMKNSFRKYFENWRYVAADRKFYGTIQWREDIYYDYEYEMMFDSKFEKIESGKAKVFDNQKRLLNTVYFGNSGSSGGLKYKAISSRMTCICNQENCSWKLSGCKNEPNNDPSSNYYWGNSWVPGPYETQKANLARAKDEFGLCKAKSAKGNIFLGYTKRYNGHNLATKDKLYCQSASSEGCEETTFNFKGLLLKALVL